MLKKDNIYLGIALGILTPLLFYGLLYLINVQTAYVKDGISVKRFDDSSLQALSIFVNLFPFRYYMIKLKYDNTGKGILLVTFLMVITYFFLNSEDLFK